MAAYVRFERTYTGAGLCVLPQIPFVGGVLDVVTDVVVHPVSRCAVSSIENLKCERRSFSPVATLDGPELEPRATLRASFTCSLDHWILPTQRAAFLQACLAP